MLIPNHPHDERLSALASGDSEATGDRSLGEHVASCAECTQVIGELSALRASLAELPDLQPNRPLRLLPEVADAPSRADRLGGWARRLFTPALTAGAALAMVGAVGTAAPALPFGTSGAALQDQDTAETELRALSSDGTEFQFGGAGAESSDATLDTFGEGAAEPTAETSERLGNGGTAPSGPVAQEVGRDGSDGGGAESVTLPAERSPWPMVLFGGVALMIAAALLRWILAPRAG